jgi:hypothetical protein
MHYSCMRGPLLLLRHHKTREERALAPIVYDEKCNHERQPVMSWWANFLRFAECGNGNLHVKSASEPTTWRWEIIIRMCAVSKWEHSTKCCISMGWKTKQKIDVGSDYGSLWCINGIRTYQRIDSARKNAEVLFLILRFTRSTMRSQWGFCGGCGRIFACEIAAQTPNPLVRSRTAQSREVSAAPIQPI